MSFVIICNVHMFETSDLFISLCVEDLLCMWRPNSLRILSRFLFKILRITILRLIAMLSYSVLQHHTGRELQVHDNLAEWNL